MTVCSTLLPPAYRFSTESDKRLLTVELPSIESLVGIDLEIGSDDVRLMLPGRQTHEVIHLPPELASHAGSPVAKFSKKRHVLTIAWDNVAADLPDVTESPSANAPEPQRLSDAEATTSQVLPDASDESAEPAHPSKEMQAPERTYECFDLLEEEIEHALKQCTVKQLRSISAIGGCSVLLSDFEVEGTAHMSKHACSFKASVSFKWEVMDPIGGFLGAGGVGEVANLTQQSESPKVSIKAPSSGSARAKAACEWMKQRGGPIIAECLNGEQLSSAVHSSFDEVAEEEEANATSQQLPSQWAEEWLVQKFSTLNVKLFGGSACVSFSKPNVSMSDVDSRDVAALRLSLTCPWVMTASAKKVEGTISISEYLATDSKGVPTPVLDVAPDQKVSGQLLTAFKQTGISAVRSVLVQLAKELQVQFKK
eukprot:TRINITY_DN29910_c0_g1_i1.p1 TRINITY_DN29910_c0_g1~~TRINITY_DN29910_c0_g1_i1.p1  ORF type:complete len:447 (-),score=57.90 TRINITY_DN29910_c0_g1_i1:155-1426(-)